VWLWSYSVVAWSQSLIGRGGRRREDELTQARSLSPHLLLLLIPSLLPFIPIRLCTMSLLPTLVALLAASTSVAAAASLPNPLFAAYWGQSNEQSLISYCQMGYFNGQSPTPPSSQLRETTRGTHAHLSQRDPCFDLSRDGTRSLPARPSLTTTLPPPCSHLHRVRELVRREGLLPQHGWVYCDRDVRILQRPGRADQGVPGCRGQDLDVVWRSDQVRLWIVRVHGGLLCTSRLHALNPSTRADLSYW
jgi:hypothetical protein